MATNVYLGRNGNWADVANWSLAAIPVDDDDVVIPDTTQTSLTTNLDRTGDSAGAGLDLDSIFIHEGYSGNIGSLGNPLRCTVLHDDVGEPSILHRGSGQLWYNAERGTAPATYTGIIVVNSRNMAELSPAATISGDLAIMRLSCVCGVVNLTAAYSGALAGLYVVGQSALCVLGNSVAAITIGWQTAGIITAERAITTFHMAGGVCTYTLRAPTMIHQSGGLVIWNSATILAALYLMRGTFDTTRTAIIKTITNLHIFPEGVLLRTSQLTVTNPYDEFDIDTD